MPSSRSHPMADGERVRVAYDPADPRKVLVLGLVLVALVLLVSAA